MTIKFFFLFLLTISSVVSSTEKNTSSPIEEDAKLYTNLKKSQQFADAFKSQPDFEPAMESCKKTQSYSACIEEYISNKKFSFEDIEKMIKELDPNLNVTDYAEKQKAQNKVSGLLDYNSSTNISSEKTQDYFILRKYLSDQLTTAMYGEGYLKGDLSKTKITDHVTFVKLYRSQLGKNVLLELSRFCLENFPSSSNSQGDYEASQANTYQNEIKSKFNTAASTEKEGKHYQACSVCINYFCHQDDKIKQAPNCKSLLQSANNQDDVKKNACILVPRLRKYRETITKMDDIQNILKDKHALEDSTGFDVKQAGFAGTYEEKGADQGEKTLDELTTLTSSEVINDSGLGKKLDQEYKNFEEKCLKSKDTVACKKLVEFQDKQKSLEDLENEFDTKTELLLAKLGTEEGVKEYIMSVKGKTEAEMNKIMTELEDDSDLQNLRNEYKDQLKRERDELKKQIIAKMKETSINDLQKDKQELKNVGDILIDKKDRLQRLFHYNNIVTAYIKREMDDGGQKVKISDVSSLQREISDSAFSDDDKYFTNFKTSASTALKQIQSQYKTRTPSSKDTDTSNAITPEFLDTILGDDESN